jgi:hypothetical protein
VSIFSGVHIDTAKDLINRVIAPHRTLSWPDWPDYVFAFHDSVEVGPRMLARIARRTGLHRTTFDTYSAAARNRRA